MNYQKKKHSGVSIVEVLVSFIIISIIIGAAITIQTNTFTVNKAAKDRSFAGQKAMQMMEEMKSLSEGGETNDDTLESRSNQPDAYTAVLTTEKLKGSLTNIIDSKLDSSLPSSSTSGNFLYKGKWKFVRNVLVERIPGDAKARKVTIKVYYAEFDTDGKLKGLGTPLAQLSTILKTIASPNFPSQVIDTYALAISNIPGWWASMPEMRKMYESIIYDLRDKNTGLDFKSHYITVNSYGRDILYAPYINKEVETEADTNSTFAYFYPGKVKNTKNNLNRMESYYSLEDISEGIAKGRVLTYQNSAYRFINDYASGSVSNLINSVSYPIADQFNNATRYPDELAIYTRLNKLAKNNNQEKLEPTYRLLMEDMNSTKDYRNAIISNLHGELFPFIPLRNYSDPAKDMVKAENRSIRVVTHPEKISYPSTENDINLRVHVYNRPGVGADTNAAKYLEDTITLFIPLKNSVGPETGPIAKLNMPGFDISSGAYFNETTNTNLINQIKNNININYIEGDDTTPYKRYIYYPSGSGTNPLPTGSVDISVNPLFDSNSDGSLDENGDGSVDDKDKTPGILIKLKGTSIAQSGATTNRIPTNAARYGTAGLNINKKLYGMDYIPTPLINTGFDPIIKRGSAISVPARDLDNNTDIVKNTARFIVSLNVADGGVTNWTATNYNPLSRLKNKMVTIETRIGEDLNTGTRMDGTIPTKTGIPTSVSSPVIPISQNYSDSLTRSTNLSRTYVWVGDQAYNSMQSIPFTERFQVMGDPRHNPYKDTVDNQEFNVAFTNSSQSGLAAINVGTGNYDIFNITGKKLAGPLFGGDNVNNDVPRMFQIFRQGLLNSNATYTSMIGYTHYYYGIGGEMGGDTSNPQFFSMNAAPFNQTGYVGIRDDQNGGVANEIISGSSYIQDSANTWFSIPFLGEIYPDSSFNQWLSTGNLSSLGTPRFYRSKLGNQTFNVNGTNSAFINKTVNKRLTANGCSTLFNGGFTSGSYFNHQSTGTIDAIITKNPANTQMALGDDMNTSLGSYFEDTKANRPFTLDSNNTPPQRSNNEIKARYSPLNTKISFIDDTKDINNLTTIYRDSASSLAVSGIVKMYQDSGSKNENTPGNRAYIISNGLIPAGESGNLTVAKLAITSMLYSFLRTADINNTGLSDNFSIPIPYVGLTSNNLPDTETLSGVTPAEGYEVNGNTIPMEFVLTWKKWDMKKYTTIYADDWEPDISKVRLKYNVMYSADNGKNWRYPNGSTAIPGTYNAAYEVTPSIETAKAGDEDKGIKRLKYDFNITGFQRDQNTIFRVEAYRQAYNPSTGQFELINQHYSYHQREYYLK